MHATVAVENDVDDDATGGEADAMVLVAEAQKMMPSKLLLLVFSHSSTVRMEYYRTPWCHCHYKPHICL